MSKPVSHQQLQDIECYKRMFIQFHWELTLTTRIPTDIHIDDAHELLVAQILAPLASALNRKLSALSVVVPATVTAEGPKPAHIHSLVLSYEGGLAARDTEIQAFILDNQSPDSLLQNADSCVVKPITDATYYRNATTYAAKNFASVAGATLNPYKKRLLAKRMRKYDDK